MYTDMSSEPQRLWQEFGAKLRAARKAKGWTQEQLASATGMAQNSISNYERGKTPPSVETLATLAAALGTTMDALWPTPSARPNAPRKDANAPEDVVAPLSNRLQAIEARLWDLYAYVEVMAEVLQAKGIDLPMQALQERFQRYRNWIAATPPDVPATPAAPPATASRETASPKSKA